VWRMVSGYELVYRRVLAEHSPARRLEPLPVLMAESSVLPGSPAMTVLR
jgi:hypothetical protein